MAAANYSYCFDQNSDKYTVIPSTAAINVLLIGRTQTGKSTIIQTLKDPTYSVEARAFSDTKDPMAACLCMRNNSDGKHYQLNVIDTPGLKECMRDGESRSDSELMSLLNRLLALKISSLNVVCFVSRAGQTHLHDLEVFSQLMNVLGPKFSEISMMILTHCSEFSESQLNQFEADIRQHSKSKSVSEYCRLGIKRAGALNRHGMIAYLEDVDDDNVSKEVQINMAVTRQLKRTRAMRCELLDAWISTEGKSISTSEFSSRIQTDTVKQNVATNTDETRLSEEMPPQSQDVSPQNATNSLENEPNNTDEGSLLLENVNLSNRRFSCTKLACAFLICIIGLLVVLVSLGIIFVEHFFPHENQTCVINNNNNTNNDL